MLGVIDGGEFLRFAALTQDSYSRSDTRFAARGRSWAELGMGWKFIFTIRLGDQYAGDFDPSQYYLWV